MTLIEGLINSLDTPEEDETTEGNAELKSYSVSGGNAETIYNVLQTLLAGKKVRLSMDAKASSIVALASPDVQQEISQTVRQLQEGQAEFAAIGLTHVDAYFAVSLIEEMLDLDEEPESTDYSPSWDRRRDSDRTRRDVKPPPVDKPKIDADPANRRLFVLAKRDQLGQIKKSSLKLTWPILQRPN